MEEEHIEVSEDRVKGKKHTFVLVLVTLIMIAMVLVIILGLVFL